jgi:hypothetical protein
LLTSYRLTDSCSLIATIRVETIIATTNSVRIKPDEWTLLLMRHHEIDL